PHRLRIRGSQSILAGTAQPDRKTAPGKNGPDRRRKISAENEAGWANSKTSVGRSMIAQFMGRGEAVEIFSQPFGLSNEIKLPYPPPRTGGREARFHPASAADVQCKRKP